MQEKQPISSTRRALLVSITVLVLLLAFGALAAFLVHSVRQQSVTETQSIQQVQQQQGQPPAMHDVQLDNGHTLSLPPGFTVTRWVTGRGALRMMAVTTDGYLLVTEMDRGNVLAFRLSEESPSPVTMISGLHTPSGICVHDGQVWVAETAAVSRYPYNNNAQVGSRVTVIPDLPTGGHDTRTVGFGPDGKLYLSVGSSCNVCEETDPRRAAVLRYNEDGSGMEIFASGLRNTVGFDWNPVTSELWGVDNGRDLIGDDLPPDEVNIIRQGLNYGWPYCYGDRMVNPEYQSDPSRTAYCQATEPPVVELQAHSAPLGMRFLDDPAWPMGLQGNIFTAFHGSWNRSVPTGYKVVNIGTDRKVYDFLTGWLQPDGNNWGRPVDILFANHSMYVSDDYSGAIYRVSRE